jgi:sugar lactone lactonase YvrE
MLRLRATLLVCLLAITAACSNSHDSGSAPLPLLARYELSSTDSVPEGVAFDPQQRSFYATSLHGGGIVRIDASGREFVFREPDYSVRIVGAKVDAQRRKLWVCAEIEGGDDRVWVFGLADAKIEREYLLSDIASNASCNDLVVSTAGIAYVTDSVNPNVYKLDPALNSNGELLVTDPRFADVTGAGLGLNGIALTPDENALLVGKYVPASMFRIGLGAADDITPITLSGDTLPAPDGLALLNNDLYAVSNASVSRLRFNAVYTAAEVKTVAQESGLSTATVAESQLYVVKSEVAKFVLGQPLDLPFEIFRVDLNAFNP